MSDELDLVKVATHGGAAISGMGLWALIKDFFKRREEREARDAFVLLTAEVKHLSDEVAKMTSLARQVWEADNRAVAAHKRLDDLGDVKGRVSTLEQKVSALEARRK